MDNQTHSSASSSFNSPPGSPAEGARRAGRAPAGIKLESARLLVLNGLIGSTEMIEPYATASGITCQTFGRAHSALTAMKQAAMAGNPFDVAFVERVLPDMDPFEFARAVQGDRQISDARLILISTFGASSADDARARGLFFAHLSKPNRQIEVLNAVQAALAGDSHINDAGKKLKTITLPAARAGRHMILVAEDNPVTQMMVLHQLKERGFFAQVVTNGVDAVQAAKNSEFDAILMDCQMPQMDGFQASRQIRHWERQTGKLRIPIIAMTAYTGENDRSRCLLSGMDDYMSKPVTFGKLEAVLSKWLDFELSFKTEGAMDKQNDIRSQWNQPQSQQPPVDFEGLSEMLGSTEAGEILQLFVTSTQELLDKIDEALTNHDGAALREAAHTLKGASSSIGAHSMWQQSIELETAAKSADWQRLPELLNGLCDSFEQAKSFISNHV